MLKCESVSARIDDYLDGNLADQEQEAMAQHLKGCETCRKEYQLAKNLLEQLSKIEVPTPRPGYEQRVLRFLEDSKQKDFRGGEKHGQHKPHALPMWFAAGFTTAAIAIFVVLFAFNSPVFEQAEKMPVLTVELQPLQTRKVDLVFNSPEHIQNASLRIELPQGTEIAGYPNRNSLEWQTTLKKGTNRLSLPLIVKEKQGGKLYARITHEGQTRTFELNVVALPASSQYTTIQAS